MLCHAVWSPLLLFQPEDAASACRLPIRSACATAVSNSASREALARLAEEQAALRRVATLVAQGVPRSELFGAVAQTVGRLFGADRVDAAVARVAERAADPYSAVEELLKD